MSEGDAKTISLIMKQLWDKHNPHDDDDKGLLHFLDNVAKIINSPEDEAEWVVIMSDCDNNHVKIIEDWCDSNKQRIKSDFGQLPLPHYNVYCKYSDICVLRLHCDWVTEIISKKDFMTVVNKK